MRVCVVLSSGRLLSSTGAGATPTRKLVSANGANTMLKMAVGSTEELDGELAASDVLAQCAEGLDGRAAQAGLLFACHDLDLQAAPEP